MKSLKESIISNTQIGQDALIKKIKDNLMYCHDIIGFSGLWNKLGLDINGLKWKYDSVDGYIYNKFGHKCLVFCLDVTNQNKYPSIFIYEREDYLSKNDCSDYVKKVASKLKMKYVYNKAGWYELTFK